MLRPYTLSAPCIFTCLRFHLPASSPACVFTCLRFHLPAFSTACVFTCLHFHLLCIFTCPQHFHRPIPLPPSRVIPNVPSDTIQMVTIADDLIEIVPLPDPADSSAT